MKDAQPILSAAEAPQGTLGLLLGVFNGEHERMGGTEKRGQESPRNDCRITTLAHGGVSVGDPSWYQVDLRYWRTFPGGRQKRVSSCQNKADLRRQGVGSMPTVRLSGGYERRIRLPLNRAGVAPGPRLPTEHMDSSVQACNAHSEPGLGLVRGKTRGARQGGTLEHHAPQPGATPEPRNLRAGGVARHHRRVAPGTWAASSKYRRAGERPALHMANLKGNQLCDVPPLLSNVILWKSATRISAATANNTAVEHLAPIQGQDNPEPGAGNPPAFPGGRQKRVSLRRQVMGSMPTVRLSGRQEKRGSTPLGPKPEVAPGLPSSSECLA